MRRAKLSTTWLKIKKRIRLNIYCGSTRGKSRIFRSLVGAEKNYLITDLECLAIMTDQQLLDYSLLILDRIKINKVSDEALSVVFQKCSLLEWLGIIKIKEKTIICKLYWNVETLCNLCQKWKMIHNE
ncbi:hypothetical protein RCL_jg22562.t1 [Rhizophagus clarus]|uniref:Uncharacterized protein n=1 Tax=Rhizophagus clarus TaxID=94130 RepID=A0A8H3MIU1_9GLOM|nr:hypothetical protein RCL_jg22562.t1 [Rhizophagus clarus]